MFEEGQQGGREGGREGHEEDGAEGAALHVRWGMQLWKRQETYKTQRRVWFSLGWI